MQLEFAFLVEGSETNLGSPYKQINAFAPCVMSYQSQKWVKGK